MKKPNKDFIRKVVTESMRKIRVQEAEQEVEQESAPEAQTSRASTKDVESFLALLNRLPNREPAAAKIDKSAELEAIIREVAKLLSMKGIEQQELRIAFKNIFMDVQKGEDI